MKQLMWQWLLLPRSPIQLANSCERWTRHSSSHSPGFPPRSTQRRQISLPQRMLLKSVGFQEGPTSFYCWWEPAWYRWVVGKWYLLISPLPRSLHQPHHTHPLLHFVHLHIVDAVSLAPVRVNTKAEHIGRSTGRRRCRWL